MAVIDIGPGATNRAATWSFDTFPGYVLIDYNNPANDTGILDTFEIYATTDLAGVKIGTFSGSGTSWAMRDYESIGSVTSGSKQTFTGKNCSVETNDVLAILASGGALERVTSGAGGCGYIALDTFADNDAHTYNALSGDAVSIYATGATAAAGSLPLKNVFGRPFSGVFR